MMHGLDEFYSGLIEEAKSPEEIKKILEYQFVQGKGVPQEVLDAVLSVDPTKKKSYTKWVLMQWERDKEGILAAIKSNRISKLFNYFKTREQNGLQLGNMKSFDEAIAMLPEEDPIFEKDGDGPENDFDIVFESNEWKIAVPHTYEADKKLGQGCRWCTAGAFGDGESFWNRYSAEGPLWVNFDLREHEICPMDKKEYPYKRYQFLFEHGDWHGELMDSNDDRIDDFSDLNMPEDVIEFYGEQNERYRDMIENGVEEDLETRWERYQEERWNHAQNVKEYNDSYLTLLPEEEGTPEFNENCYYYLYDEDDTADPISYVSFNPDEDYIVNEFEEMPIVLLRDQRGRQCVAWYNESKRYNNWEVIEDGIDFCAYVGNAGKEDAALVVNGTCEIFNGEGSYTSFKIPINGDLESINYNIEIIKSYQGGPAGAYFEVVYTNGFHSLLFFSHESYDTEVIITKDKPMEGQECFLCSPNGVIKAYYNTYSIGEDNQDVFRAEQHIDDENVIISINNGQQYNVLNLKTRKRMFAEGSKIPNYICLLWDKYLRIRWTDSLNNDVEQIASLQGTPLTTTLKSISFIDNHKMKLVVGIDNIGRMGDKKLIYNANKDFEIVGKVYDIACVVGDNAIAVRLNQEKPDFKVLNVLTGEMTLPDGLTRWGTLDNLGLPFIMASGPVLDGCGLYNYETGEQLVDNMAPYRPTFMTVVNRVTYYRYKTHDGKYNIFTNAGKKYLPQDVSDIESMSQTREVFRMRNEDKIYWIDFSKNKLLPSNDGIDRGSISNVIDREGYAIIFKGDGTKIQYNFKDETFDVTTGDGREGDRTIGQNLLYPASAAVNESFKNTYKRIIDARKLF